ncbi:MAG: Fur family transcriptional regulator [Candidatus Bipolaricaulota bacterium]
MQKDKLKEFREKLKEEGFKVTPQRIEVVNALVKLDHPTAKEIKQHIEDRYPMISPSTIYGTLDLLENMGELIPIQEGAETKYDLSPEVHPHFICEEDGEVRDIDDHEMESKLRELLKECPFEADRIELNFYGKCDGESPSN